VTAQTAEEKSKELVMAFYGLALNQRKPTEAAGRYIGPHPAQSGGAQERA
jgi:hypothetical protein